MRIDIVSIFPEYLAALDLSLPGKAQAAGLLEVVTHDLRQWTQDRHHTVDDTPYGGGAGMVMKPEPWGEALDEVLLDDAVLVVPTPSGRLFSQTEAAELSTIKHLVFACGRYEGIDQRVIDEAADRVEVREVSIGDYVLNGGEVAALVMIEAIVRLIPGFMGNPESLAEESHSDGLLEYPVYTKPATWRGHHVPEVLLSGNHAKIASWRREQSLRRTANRRPDLLPPSAVGEHRITVPVQADAAEILVLQRACWMQEAQANDTLDIPPLLESLEDVRADLADWDYCVVRSEGRLIGAVRGQLVGDVWHVGRLMVAPDHQGKGLGRALLEHIELLAPAQARTLELFTGSKSTANLKMYKLAGYRVKDQTKGGIVTLTKRKST